VAREEEERKKTKDNRSSVNKMRNEESEKDGAAERAHREDG
jgi:hypothetical protein